MITRSEGVLLKLSIIIDERRIGVARANDADQTDLAVQQCLVHGLNKMQAFIIEEISLPSPRSGASLEIEARYDSIDERGRHALDEFEETCHASKVTAGQMTAGENSTVQQTSVIARQAERAALRNEIKSIESAYIGNIKQTSTPSNMRSIISALSTRLTRVQLRADELSKHNDKIEKGESKIHDAINIMMNNIDKAMNLKRSQGQQHM